jgi:hypothetical protein
MTIEKVAYLEIDTHRYIHIAEIDKSEDLSNDEARAFFSDTKRQVGPLRVKTSDGEYYEPSLWNFVYGDIAVGVHRTDKINVQLHPNQLI